MPHHTAREFALLRQFIAEAHGLSKAQEFMIRSWGKLLYLDYFNLPPGPDMSNTPGFKKLVSDYLSNLDDEDEMEELDEWISEGAPMKNGDRLITKTTVDSVLKSCQVPAGRKLTLYRFDHTPSKLRPNSWISMTLGEGGYLGTRSSYELGPDDLVIFTHGWADEDEVIVNTNELLSSR